MISRLRLHRDLSESEEMSLRYHNDLMELSLRSLRSRDVSTTSMSVNFIMHSRVFLDSFQSVHNTIWTMAVVQQQAGLLLGLIYLEQIQEDEDLINLLRRRRQRRAARRRRTWVRQWLDVGRRFHFCQYHRFMPELRNEDPASFF